jgi:ABC-type dipeptide/oligopeptide/nickel transport system permease subunit
MSVTGSTIIGITSGYLGGIYEPILQRGVYGIQTLLGLVFFLTVMAIVGAGLW